MKKRLDYGVYSKILVCIFVCAIIGASIYLVINFIQLDADINNMNEAKLSDARIAAIRETTNGPIVDKRMENAYSNIFRSIETEYRIFILVEYEYDGITYVTDKYYSVPVETYLAYDIGDHFDSRDFKLGDQQTNEQ